MGALEEYYRRSKNARENRETDAQIAATFQRQQLAQQQMAHGQRMDVAQFPKSRSANLRVQWKALHRCRPGGQIRSGPFQ